MNTQYNGAFMLLFYLYFARAAVARNKRIQKKQYKKKNFIKTKKL